MSGKRRYCTRGLQPRPTLAELAAMERLTVTTPEQELVARGDAAVLRRAFACLTAREERVIRLRFGIDCEPQTLDQVAEVLGTCHERPRQLERKALGKLGKRLLTKFRERPGAARMRRERDDAFREAQEARVAAQARAEAKAERERQKQAEEAEHLRRKQIEWDVLREAKRIQLFIWPPPLPPAPRPRRFFDLPEHVRRDYAEVMGMLLSPHRTRM